MDLGLHELLVDRRGQFGEYGESKEDSETETGEGNDDIGIARESQCGEVTEIGGERRGVERIRSDCLLLQARGTQEEDQEGGKGQNRHWS